MYNLSAKFSNSLIVPVGVILDYPNGKLIRSIDEHAIKAVENLCESFETPDFKLFREELLQFSTLCRPGRDMSGQLSFYKLVSDRISDVGMGKNIFIVEAI